MIKWGALVSVCITSFNYGRYIRDAIESALAQTYPHIEVIVSDNGSTDDTHDILASYRHDPRVRVFVNEYNVGLCGNHNLAIRRSHGDYIVVLSADDVLFPEHVDHLMRRIHDPRDPVLIATGQGVFFTESLEPIAPMLAFGNLPLAYSRRDDFANLLLMYYHMYPAKVIARSVYEQVGLFDERIIRGIDIDLCARIEAADIPSAFVPELVAGMRRHGNSIAVRSKEPDTFTTHAAHSDRLYAYENALDPRNAWRLEGCEPLLLAIAEQEFAQLAQPVDEQLTQRLARLRSTLTAYANVTPEWPQNEPQLSVVVVSEGHLALLKTTLDAIAAQDAERIEIVVVQSSGYNMQPWLSGLPYADRVRLIQARACASTMQAYRYGLDLARGEFVTYLAEGKHPLPQIYADLLRRARETNVQVIIYPPADEDAASGTHSLSQLLHRRAILRATSMSHEYMVNLELEHFLSTLISAYRPMVLTGAPCAA